MKDKNNKSMRLVVIIVLAVFFGLAAVFLVVNMAARGDSDVTATVRVADGESEDELYMSSMTITRRVAGSILSNEKEYVVGNAKVSDDQSVIFSDCTLTGIYAPEKCTANDGVAYWITLTEIK